MDELEYLKVENKRKDAALQDMKKLVKELHLKIGRLDIAKLENGMTQGEMQGVIEELAATKESIQGQARKIEKAVSSALPTSLPDMPLEILLNILGNLHFKELLLVRKVSKPLLKIVDDQLMDSKITSVFLFTDRYSFEVNIDDREIMNYSSAVSREKLNATALMEKTMTGILRFKPSPLDKLTLCYGCAEPTNKRSKLEEERHNTYLETIPSILKTKSLSISSHALKSVSGILRYIEPKILESLSVGGVEFSTLSRFNAEWDLDQSELVKTEHWKQLKRVHFEHRIEEAMLLKHFDHLEECQVVVRRNSSQTLIKLKKMLLSPDSVMRQFFIRCWLPLERFTKDFGEPIVENGFSWRLETPDPTVMLHVDRFNMGIRFSRVQIDN